MYREPPAPVAPRRVQHGPFPIRPWLATWGVVMIGTGVLVAVVALRTQRLSCGDASHAPRSAQVGVPRCELREGSTPSRTLLGGWPENELRGVRVVEDHTVNRGRRTDWGTPYLLFSSQRELRLSRVPLDDAQRFAAAVDGGLHDPSRPFSVELHEPRGMVLAAMAIALFGLALFVGAVRGLGRFTLDVDPAGARVIVRRRVLGLPLGTRSVSTVGVDDVEIEWRHHHASRNGQRYLHESTARLVLVADGERRPLTDRSYRGHELHLRAADALRAALDCPSRSAERSAALAQSDAQAVPPSRGITGFFAVWLGLCCGSLVGIALYGVLGIALGVFHGKDPLDGTAALVGGGGGALLGVALALAWSRRRPR